MRIHHLTFLRLNWKLPINENLILLGKTKFSQRLMLNEIHLFQFFLNPSFQRKIFWAKAILKTLTFTCTLNAYVTRTKQSTRFHSGRVNTEPFENVQKSPSKLSNEKIRLFLKRSSELDGFKFIWKNCCLALLCFQLTLSLVSFLPTGPVRVTPQ